MDRDPDRNAMFTLLYSLAVIASFIVLLFLTGCAAPVNRFVRYPEANVLFTTPVEVHRLCRSAPRARQDVVYLGCYIPALGLVVAPHDDAGVLAHELRHASEGQFHK